MSIQAVAWAWEQYLPSTAKLVLLALSNDADPETGQCRFDLDVVARQSAIKPSSVWRYLGALVRNGYLTRDDIKDGEGKPLHVFWLQFARPYSEWAWNKQEDGDEAADAEYHPSSAPVAYRPKKQAEARAAVAGASPHNERVFVIKDSKAWQAWIAHRRANGLPGTMMVTTTHRDGRTLEGWWLPTLFPPRAEGLEQTISNKDADVLAGAGVTR